MVQTILLIYLIISFIVFSLSIYIGLYGGTDIFIPYLNIDNSTIDIGDSMLNILILSAFWPFVLLAVIMIYFIHIFALILGWCFKQIYKLFN